jgi:hypothetical protein
MNLKQQAMKTSINSILAAIVAVAFCAFTSFAQQTGTVWVTAKNAASLHLTVENGEVKTSHVGLENLIQQQGVTSIKKAFPASRRALSNVYELTCQCDANDLLAETAKLADIFETPEIAEAPSSLFTPNDYALAYANDYALELINAKGAWDVSRGKASVVIAITDVNYYTNHEELMGKYTVVSPNYNTDYTHGTAVAIAAAGNTGNNLGKSAIGYLSSLQLRARSYNDVLEASYSGAHVVNMSWTTGCTFNVYAQQAIDEAFANGTVLVASAGNGSTCGGADNLVYPAAYNHVIAVSSVGPNDNHERVIGNPSTTHQHNASVDICAPGYDVAISTAPGVYTTGSGTSYAAPLVSGTIALMLAKNPCLTPDQIEYILKTSAVNIDALNPNYIGKLGAGRLDAEAALVMAANFSTYTVQGTTAVECTNMTQSIALDMTNVPAPFTIRWNNEDTTIVLSQLQGGSYSATIKDANSCVASFSTNLDTILPIVIETSVAPVLCNGMNNGAIDLMVVGGTGAYAYNWSNGTTAGAVNGVIAGTYTVEVTDEKGCTSAVSVEVTEPAALQSTVAVIEGNIELTVTGGTFPYNYEWNNGAVESNINEATPGFYEVLVTDANGCMVSSNTTVEETSTASIEEGNNVEFTVYPNPAKDNATIQWNNAEVSTVELITLTGTIVQTINTDLFAGQTTLNGVATGEYLVRITTTTGQTHMNKVIFL